MPVAPPATPANLTATGEDGQVRLSWSGALGATGYVVKRSLASGGPYATVASHVKGARYVDGTVVNGYTVIALQWLALNRERIRAEN